MCFPLIFRDVTFFHLYYEGVVHNCQYEKTILELLVTSQLMSGKHTHTPFGPKKIGKNDTYRREKNRLYDANFTIFFGPKVCVCVFSAH